ncbi:hypothetical protein U1Q18_003544 [Sarracenia purpurea var. burkii]
MDTIPPKLSKCWNSDTDAGIQNLQSPTTITRYVQSSEPQPIDQLLLQHQQWSSEPLWILTRGDTDNFEEAIATESTKSNWIVTTKEKLNKVYWKDAPGA